MIFDIITIFPEIFDSYFKESIISRAQKKKLIKVNIHNLRDFATDKHKTVDDRPFGGGIGMVMKIEPIFKAITALKKSQAPNSKSQTNSKFQMGPSRRLGGWRVGWSPNSKTILFTPRGKKFNQKMAYQFSKLNQLILICGRYEGIDERVAKHIADIELSIGDYVLMGGELPAMVVVETISRLVPGIIGKPDLLKERIPAKPGRAGRGFIEYPQYTRPDVFSPKRDVYWKVPRVLLSGHHKKIEEWRKKHQKVID